MPNRGLRTLRAIDLACAVLVIVGAVRLFALVLHVPLLGYANQYDMARSSACVDLWPALPPPARYAAYQAAPLPHYEVEHVPGGPCYPSSVLAFVELAKGGVTALRWAGLIRGRSFPLQAVGIAEAVALIALMLAFIRAERNRPRARLAHAALFALILSDPAMALWMNTLYTEFATIFFAYATGGLLALAPSKRIPVATTIESVRRIPVASEDETVRHRGYLFSVMWIGALAGLAWSRQQYAAFVFVPLLIAAPQWWRRARGGWFAAVIVLIATVAMQASFIAGLPAVRAANNHDFYLGAVLPAARNEDAALTRLGLPHACREAVGSNWYVGMGADPQRECGEVDALGHLAFLRLVPDDPALPGRILARGLPLAQTWWQHYLGMVAGVSFGDWSRAQSPLAWSLADLVERVPLVGYLGIIAALAAAFVAAVTSWVCSATRRNHGDGWIRAVLFASAVAVYAPVSAIFGDGYVEVSRHALLLHPAMMAVLLLGAGRALAPRVRRAARERARAWRVAGAAAVLAALLAALLLWGARHWPTGQGVVDLPATRRFEGGVFSMRGWAVDPWGVHTVRVAAYRDLAATVPERVWMASYGHAVQGPHGESLAIYYPTYRGADRGGFALDIDRSAWPANAPCLRTRVENLRGVETEIDRRCVTR